VVACAYGTINALSLAGHRANGQRWVMFSFFGGGHGGMHPESDGLNHGNAPISTATIPPLEILEAAYPVMFTQWALRPDSGGRARIAAALARSTRSNCWRKRPRFSSSASAAASRPRACRRRAGAMNASLRAGGRLARTADGLQDARHQLERGQKLRLETPGGGGYGAPRPRAGGVARDVALGST
jgi:N-methylhydantoinase B